MISAVVAVRSLEEEERVINNLKAYPFQEIILAEGKPFASEKYGGK